VTQPRHIAPSATYAICRRTERRRFLLRPDAAMNRLFVYVLAFFANRFGIELHVATVMSTHFHLVLTVPNEDGSELIHRVDMHLARAIQILRRFVGGVVWAPGELSIVQLETPEAVIEQIAYAIANPVKAGLVFRSSDWPGITATIEDLGRKVLRAAKPAFYFLGCSDGEPWAPWAEIQLTWPACLREIGEDRARELVRAELERLELEARAFVKSKGWSVMGGVGCMNVSPYHHAKSWEELGKLVPHIAAGRGQTEARLAAIARLLEFRQKHREAKARWVAGDRNVVFPAGTYWMRVHHGAVVAPFG
jgi:REP element-mobilizing transposase RayT